MATKNYHHGDLKNALIQAGVEILAADGIGGLSLRKVAQKAGVSHTAPYAHFTDKQALIAAISTEGHRKVHTRITQAMGEHPDDPLRQLVETAWATVTFATEEPAWYRVTFSGAVEHERDYPALVESTARNYGLVRGLTVHCQAAGILQAGDPDLVTVGVWSLVHGFISLILEGQVSHAVLERFTRREMLISALNQITLVEIKAQDFPTPG
jgi:AcrR family transcriptional regulator